MKKLLFIFAVLVSLVMVAGCNARRNDEPQGTVKENAAAVNAQEEAAKEGTVVAIQKDAKADEPEAAPLEIAKVVSGKTSLPSTGPDSFLLFVPALLAAFFFALFRNIPSSKQLKRERVI